MSNFEHVILDEMIILTVIWLLVIPWAAIFITKTRYDAQLYSLVLGLGVPAFIWFIYSVVGIIRLLVDVAFVW